MLRVCPFILLTAAGPLVAQEVARVIPDYARVDPDTIYSLTVDPGDYPEEDWIFLLDDGVLEYEADGSGRTTYHQIVQILTRDGAEQWGEQSYSYVSERERLIVNWVRVVTPDGTLVSDGPSHEQESVAPVSLSYPVYEDRMVHRMTIGGLEPGTLLDISVTTEILEPRMPGNFSSGWRVNPSVPTIRSRLILDVPQSVKPHIREDNLDFPRRDLERDGRHVHIWATSDVEPPEPEVFTSWPDNGSMSINIAGPIEWADVASWYAGLASDRYELTPPIEGKVADVVLGARTLDDSLRAVYDWINEEFRYVSLSLGMGGYQPRPPAAVFETKMGDCKDKATLFVAVARRMGVSGAVVLLDQFANADSTQPSLAQFNHAIAAIERPGGRLYLDLTAELVPYGSLPPGSQGGFALLIHPDGRGETLTLPLDPPEANTSEYRLVAQLNTEGEIAGDYQQTHKGADSYALRGAMREYQQMSAKEKEQALRRMASSLFPGATGDSLEVFDSADGTIPAGVSFDVQATDATSRLGDSYVFELPMPNFASPSLIAELQRESRRHPIDIDQVVGPVSRSWVLELSLPDGWTADLPSDVEAESRFGDYQASYTQVGRTLKVVRKLSGRRGTAPRESIDELIEWLETISEDDVDYILLSPGG